MISSITFLTTLKLLDGIINKDEINGGSDDIEAKSISIFSTLKSPTKVDYLSLMLKKLLFSYKIYLFR